MYRPAGVQAGDRVTLYGPNCWEWLVAYYGIVATGAVINPINVMLKAGSAIGRQELIEHCRAHLAAYKVPRAVQFVEDVPKTSTGKIMRRSLRDIDDGTR